MSVRLFLGKDELTPTARKIRSGPLQPRPNGAACCSLVAQAPGQKGAFVPSFSEPRRVDTKPLTTDASPPVWGTRQGIGLSHRGGPGAG